MEELYRKLYSKYTNLKAKMDSELEQANRDQEIKFIKFAEAADEYIEHLKSETQALRVTIDELRNENSSLRSAKDQLSVEYEELLSEERLKVQQLCLEMKKLQDLQHGEKKEMMIASQTAELVSSGKTHETSSYSGRPPKRPRTAVGDQSMSTPIEDPIGRPVSIDATYAVPKQKPECCTRGTYTAGLGKCIFHDLIERFIGMKISVANDSEGPSLCIVHQSSGYSFSLTWVENASVDETELLYRVSSLGTFEMVAPEFMRDEIKFSMQMCPVFFNRVSRVIKT
ncbi:hypothetical protein Droror1_Dr00001632 [Drosera rotundifolia]